VADGKEDMDKLIVNGQSCSVGYNIDNPPSNAGIGA